MSMSYSSLGRPRLIFVFRIIFRVVHRRSRPLPLVLPLIPRHSHLRWIHCAAAATTVLRLGLKRGLPMRSGLLTVVMVQSRVMRMLMLMLRGTGRT